MVMSTIKHSKLHPGQRRVASLRRCRRRQLTKYRGEAKDEGETLGTGGPGLQIGRVHCTLIWIDGVSVSITIEPLILRGPVPWKSMDRTTGINQ